MYTSSSIDRMEKIKALASEKRVGIHLAVAYIF